MNYLVSMYIRGITKFRDHSDMWLNVSLVFEDFEFKISKRYDTNWNFLVSAMLTVLAKLRQPTGQRKEKINFACSLLKF